MSVLNRFFSKKGKEDIADLGFKRFVSFTISPTASINPKSSNIVTKDITSYGFSKAPKMIGFSGAWCVVQNTLSSTTEMKFVITNPSTDSIGSANVYEIVVGEPV